MILSTIQHKKKKRNNQISIVYENFKSFLNSAKGFLQNSKEKIYI